jgi:hypothetical protein
VVKSATKAVKRAVRERREGCKESPRFLHGGCTERARSGGRKAVVEGGEQILVLAEQHGRDHEVQRIDRACVQILADRGDAVIACQFTRCP